MANAMEVRVRGAEEFRALMRKAPSIVEPELRKANYTAGSTTMGKVKQFAPNKTGGIRRSISMELKPLSVKVTSALPHAKFQNDGTRAHGPRTKPYMVFKINGKWVRTKWVRGVKAKKFFERGLAASERAIVTAYERAVDAILNKLSS